MSELAARPNEAPPVRPFHEAGPVSRFFARILVGALCSLSRDALGRFGRALGRFVFALGIRRKVTLDNLAHAYPELSEDQRRGIARRAYENMAWGVLEAITASEATGEDLAEVVKWENPELLERLRAEGRGVILATAHFGSWEVFGAALAHLVPLSAVVKPLRGGLNERIVLSRLRAGMELLAGRGAVRATLGALKRGRVVAILSDQVISAEKGVFVPFFGRLASTSPGLGMAAAASGAPIVVAMALRVGNEVRVTFDGPYRHLDTGDRREDVKRTTAQITEVIEQWIRRYPDQWLWLHRRWKVKPPEGA